MREEVVFVVKNETYNLALQLTQHLKSLWRIKEQYRADAGGCQGCTGIWDSIEADLEKHVESIKGELKKHLAGE